MYHGHNSEELRIVTTDASPHFSPPHFETYQKDFSPVLRRTIRACSNESDGGRSPTDIIITLCTTRRLMFDLERLCVHQLTTEISWIPFDATAALSCKHSFLKPS
jgi:hypothetical protein